MRSIPLVVMLFIALFLITALALGWKDPGPGRVPDWTDPMLARCLEAGLERAELSLLDHPGADFTLEVLAQPVLAPESGFYGYGVVYRAQDLSHYYAFAVGGDGYYAVLRMEGDEEDPVIPWQQFPHIRRGPRENRLRVACAAAECDFAINDEHVATVEDETWLAGDVGLVVIGFDDPVTVKFSSARLWLSGD